MLPVAYLTWVKNTELQIAASRAERKLVWDLATSSVKASQAAYNETLAELRKGSQDIRPEKPSVWGHSGLLAAINDSYVGTPQSHVLITSGGTLALFLVCHALLKPGALAVVEAPAYEPFHAAVQAAGGQVLSWWRNRDTSELNLDSLALLLRKHSTIKLIVISNPHNPTGACISDQNLVKLATIGEHFSVAIVVDEVFRDLITPTAKPAAALHPNLISINGLSKVFGLSLLRCAWIVAGPMLISRIRQSQIAIENIGSEVTQRIASAVVSKLDTYRAFARKRVQENREVVAACLDRLASQGLIGGTTQSVGCVCFPRLVKVSNTRAFADRLAELGVFVVPGDYFQFPGHIRIGYGFENKSRIREAMTILERELKASV